jgi:hypothetical protein
MWLIETILPYDRTENIREGKHSNDKQQISRLRLGRHSQ